MNDIIRLATPDDCNEILDIYAPYVADTTISFEYVVPTAQEFRGRMEGIMRVYPYLVCEEGGRIVGFAYASRFKERASYDWDITLSVYFSPGHTARGLGGRMYACLERLLRLQNVQNMYGYIDSSNAHSHRFHAKQGFRQIVVYEKVGYKLGRWLDSTGFVKFIGAHETPPRPFIPFPELDGDAVRDILAGA